MKAAAVPAGGPGVPSHVQSSQPATVTLRIWAVSESARFCPFGRQL